MAADAEFDVRGDTVAIHMTSLHNDDIASEFQVLLSQNGADFETAADWSNSEDCEIITSTSAENLKIQIRARVGEPGETETFQTYDWNAICS